MKIRPLVLLIATVMAQPALSAQFPASEMNSLAGETLHVPADFNGTPTLVILAFAHEQHEEAGRVRQLVEKAQQENSSMRWYEMPVIDAPWVAQMFITNGMRKGADEAAQAHIVPQFVDETEWRTASGITSKEPLLVKVDHEGAILKTTPLSKVKTVADVASF